MTASTKTRRAALPSHLSPAAKGWIEKVLDLTDDQATDTDRALLILAAEAYDRSQTARRRVEKEGITYTDRFGAPKTHPAVTIERDARAAFARIVGQLGLDVHEEPESSEPYRGRNSRRYPGKVQ